METDDFTSSRIQDLHEAFADKNLKAISSVI
jgi:muramoyltetrapeptide carboxypeptidase LdcA involved in peptidoglycan recycling